MIDPLFGMSTAVMFISFSANVFKPRTTIWFNQLVCPDCNYMEVSQPTYQDGQGW